MPCIVVLYLNISIAHSDDDLIPIFGNTPYDWEPAIPASPVILRGRRAMVVDQVSNAIMVLTGSCRLSAEGAIGPSYCCGLCNSFKEYRLMIRCFRRLLVVQNRE
eukprot:9481979-Pyramimonas_sp.AAC.1